MTVAAAAPYSLAVDYRSYLRLEGACAMAVGAGLAAVAWPGLVVDYPYAWTGLLFVPAVLAALALFAARRHSVSPLRPGEWLTARPLASAQEGRVGLDGRRLTVRLAVESAIWIGAVCAWVLIAGSSGLLIFGTGLASIAFGAVQALAAPARVAQAERERGVRYLVARRPGLGTPELGIAPQTACGPTTPVGLSAGRELR